jgi:DNA-binding response OmpR family regulator
MSDIKKILIIEDEEDTQKLLKATLERKNFIVITASDGNAGIAIAKLEKPDLIIMDIMMPKMDGYSCLKEIRKSDKIKDTPILILSGKQEEPLRDLFTFHTISGYVEKPFELDNLIAKIKEILKV